MTNVQFKKGDVVQRTEANAYANGTRNFRHGKPTAVIDRIVEGAFGGTIAWFEHGTNIGVEDIELAERPFVPTAVKPAPLDLKGFLTALYDEEGVVSVDPDDDTVTDLYNSLEGLADDICHFEITDNDFYLEEDWDKYRKALEADKEAEAEATKAKDLDFEEAIALLAQGVAVVSFDDDGDEIDTYHGVKDLAKLAGFEIDGVWRKA